MALNPPSKAEVAVAGSDGQRTICDPLPGETPKAFAAFVQFLALGEKRSIAQVAKFYQKNDRVIALWSRKNRWQERLMAWNQRLMVVQREKAEILALEGATDWAKRQRELREKEWEVCQKGILLVNRIIDKLLKRTRRGVSLQEAARLLEVVSKVGRLATGLATDREEVSGVGGGPIQVELSAALQKVYGTPLGRMDVLDDKNALVVPSFSELPVSCTDSEPRNIPGEVDA